mgnify:CR=1 FL=1
MRKDLSQKPINEAAGEDTLSKPQSALGKETVIVKAKNSLEAAKGSRG